MKHFGWSFINGETDQNLTPTQKQKIEKTKSSNDLFKIVIVLDESGSMDNIRKQIIKSINDLITEQKQVKERPATLTLVKFNDSVNKIVNDKPLTKVHLLDYEDYTPSGTTALYDAIGQTIKRFNNDDDVLMVIVTDGQENSSREYSRSRINEMIDAKKRNNNWSYVYLSSDLNTELQGNSIGLQRSAYSSNCQVEQKHFGSFIGNNLNAAITNCRRTGKTVQSQI